MRLFGLQITRAKPVEKLQQVDNRGGWWRLVAESQAGAWQSNIALEVPNVLTHPTVYACASLIAGDIAKLPLRLVQEDDAGIWTETRVAAFSPVLDKPNRYQTRQQFVEQWQFSLHIYGNAYVLKERDNRNVVTGLYVLDPRRVRVLIADNGDVYYELWKDLLSGVDSETITIPEREIIHDRMNAFFHPLVGLSPLYASGLSAMQGLKIQNSSLAFFGNGARPGGVLTAPGEIEQATADRLKEYWETNFVGNNSGKIAVLGDGLKYEPMMMSSVDSQMIEQLRWSDEKICSCFHVPPDMVGVGPAQLNANVETQWQRYYAQCLQARIEAMEALLDEGLNLKPYGAEFDLDNLLRMDSAAQMAALDKAKSIMTLDERRKKLNLAGITGGATVYMQEQDHSIEAIAARDKLLIEQAEGGIVADAPVATPAPDDADTEKLIAAIYRKGFADAA